MAKLIPICRSCHGSPPKVKYWAAGDLCAKCADWSMQVGGMEMLGMVRISRPLLLRMLNVIAASFVGLGGGELAPGEAQEISAELGGVIDAYKTFAADGGAPTLEQLASEQRQSGAPDPPPRSGPGEPGRVWRPGDM